MCNGGGFKDISTSPVACGHTNSGSEISALFLLLLWRNTEEHVFQESWERWGETPPHSFPHSFFHAGVIQIPGLGAYPHAPEESNTFHRSCSNPVITPSFTPSYGSDTSHSLSPALCLFHTSPPALSSVSGPLRNLTLSPLVHGDHSHPDYEAVSTRGQCRTNLNEGIFPLKKKTNRKFEDHSRQKCTEISLALLYCSRTVTWGSAPPLAPWRTEGHTRQPYSCLLQNSRHTLLYRLSYSTWGILFKLHWNPPKPPEVQPGDKESSSLWPTLHWSQTCTAAFSGLHSRLRQLLHKTLSPLHGVCVCVSHLYNRFYNTLQYSKWSVTSKHAKEYICI